MRHATTGFTLVEMMVAISVMAILTTIAIPSYQSTITSTRMRSEIGALLADLNFARSEAVKRGLSINICPPTSTGTACNPGITDWSSGWVVLNTSQPLRISAGVTHGDKLIATTGTAPTFTPAGYSFFSGTFTLHDSNDDITQRRCINFSVGFLVTQAGALCP